MTGILTDAELASMRAVLNTSLPGTAVLERFTASSDGQGGQTETWTHAGTIACRIGPLPGSEVTVADRLSTHSVVQATFAAQTDIGTKDRITESGVTYEVVDIDSPRSYEIATRATLVEVDG